MTAPTLTDEQLDGRTCIVCAERDGAMQPTPGIASDRSMHLFAHVDHHLTRAGVAALLEHPEIHEVQS